MTTHDDLPVDHDPGPATCDVLVTKPGYESVRLGPFLPLIAAHHVSGLRQQMTGTAHPVGTTVSVARHHDGACDHPGFDLTTPHDPWVIATMIDQERGDANQRFPDLWARLHLRYGYEEASRLWQQACAIYGDVVAVEIEAC
jgi:hypothetical protein